MCASLHTLSPIYTQESSQADNGPAYQSPSIQPEFSAIEKGAVWTTNWKVWLDSNWTWDLPDIENAVLLGLQCWSIFFIPEILKLLSLSSKLCNSTNIYQPNLCGHGPNFINKEEPCHIICPLDQYFFTRNVHQCLCDMQVAPIWLSANFLMKSYPPIRFSH